MSTCITERLLAMQEQKYKTFSASLIPTVDSARVLGVRIPLLRRLVKDLRGTEEGEAFLRELPHEYHEENILHALLLNEIGEPTRFLVEIERFLPHVDNWSVCDTLRPRCFKDKASLLAAIRTWLTSPHPYTIRFGIEMLMVHFLGEDFQKEQLALVAEIESEEYYVNMMIAWYFATALSFQYESTLPYLTEGKLSPWLHRKTIQKAAESFRIPKERKEFLKTLRYGRKETV